MPPKNAPVPSKIQASVCRDCNNRDDGTLRILHVGIRGERWRSASEPARFIDVLCAPCVSPRRSSGRGFLCALGVPPREIFGTGISLRPLRPSASRSSGRDFSAPSASLRARSSGRGFLCALGVSPREIFGTGISLRPLSARDPGRALRELSRRSEIRYSRPSAPRAATAPI